jgi:hypothetical protein
MATAEITPSVPEFDWSSCFGTDDSFRAWAKQRGLFDHVRFEKLHQSEEHLVWQYENVDMNLARRMWIARTLRRSGRWTRANRRAPWVRVRPEPVSAAGEIAGLEVAP